MMYYPGPHHVPPNVIGRHPEEGGAGGAPPDPDGHNYYRGGTNNYQYRRNNAPPPPRRDRSHPYPRTVDDDNIKPPKKRSKVEMIDPPSRAPPGGGGMIGCDGGGPVPVVVEGQFDDAPEDTDVGEGAGGTSVGVEHGGDGGNNLLTEENLTTRETLREDQEGRKSQREEERPPSKVHVRHHQPRQCSRDEDHEYRHGTTPPPPRPRVVEPPPHPRHYRYYHQTPPAHPHPHAHPHSYSYPQHQHQHGQYHSHHNRHWPHPYPAADESSSSPHRPPHLPRYRERGAHQGSPPFPSSAPASHPNQAHHQQQGAVTPPPPPHRITRPPTRCVSVTKSMSSEREHEEVARMTTTGEQQHGHKRGRGINPSGPPSTPVDDAVDQHVVEELGENDVLCGRGKGVNDYVGNRRFRSLVRRYRDEYLNSNRGDKTNIARLIVELVRQRDPPGRFLKRSSGGSPGDAGGSSGPPRWYEVGRQVALEKTSQALREGSPRHAMGGGGGKQQRSFSSSSASSASSSSGGAALGVGPGTQVGQRRDHRHHAYVSP